MTGFAGREQPFCKEQTWDKESYSISRLLRDVLILLNMNFFTITLGLYAPVVQDSTSLPRSRPATKTVYRMSYNYIQLQLQVPRVIL